MKKKNKYFLLIFVIILFLTTIVAFLKSQAQDSTNTSSQQTSDNQLFGKWQVISVKENDNTIVTEGNNTTITFSGNGVCAATGGCNEMMNCQYEIFPNSKISISIGGTKKSCSQDIVEYWDLNDVTSYDFTDNNLSLHYEKESGVKGSFILTKLSQ